MSDYLPSMPDAQSETEVQSTEPVSGVASMALPITDEEFLSLSTQKLSEATSYFNERQVDARRRTNESFWAGKQLENEDDYDPDLRNVDNLIYQDFETRITLAASRIPSTIVSSPNDDPDSVERERLLEEIINTRLTKPDKERLIKNGLRHHGLYFIGIAKVRWDKSLGKNGDVTFEIVRPQNVILDSNGKIPDDGYTADGMEFIAEYIEEPLSVVASKFPDKRDELYQLAGAGSNNKLSRPIRYLEVWFTYYDKGGKKYEATGWRYKDLVLDVRLNPYFDFDGYEVAPEEIGGEVETKFHNHFDFPRKPYIFFSYQNLGLDPLDTTTVVEQAIPLQKLANKRQRQITAIADRTVPKYFFSGKAITREGAAEVNNDPNEHVVLEEGQFEDIRSVMMAVNAQPPSPILMQDLASIRNQIDGKFSTHETTRGINDGQNESGRAKQVVREGDLTIADDLARVVVQRVTFEMANWLIQMMKLNYQDAHFIHDIGKDGKAIHAELTRDMIDDGLLVTVDPSSTDKEERAATAMALAQQKAIDPFTMFEEMGVANPKERTERLMAYLQGPNDMFARYNEMLGLNPPAQAPMADPMMAAVGEMAAEPAMPAGTGAPDPDQEAALVDEVIANGGV